MPAASKPISAVHGRWPDERPADRGAVRDLVDVVDDQVVDVAARPVALAFARTGSSSR